MTRPTTDWEHAGNMYDHWRLVADRWVRLSVMFGVASIMSVLIGISMLWADLNGQAVLESGLGIGWLVACLLADRRALWARSIANAWNAKAINLPRRRC